jgi:hypothetical protein
MTNIAVTSVDNRPELEDDRPNTQSNSVAPPTSRTKSTTPKESSSPKRLAESALTKDQMNAFVSAAAEKGFAPSKLAKLCFKIDSVEKKYGYTYDTLIAKFEELRKATAEKDKELKILEKEIASTTRKKDNLLEQYYLDEKKVQDFVDAKESLATIGFDIDKLQSVKNSLLAMRKEGFNSASIVEKLNAIGDLESRKNTLQKDLNSLSGELRAKKNHLIQARKLQDTGITIEQIERIRELVSKIASSHGINSDQSFERFENDVMKNYNVALGLESEVDALKQNKEALASELNQRKKEFEEEEKRHSDKIKKFEDAYEAQKREFEAFSELNAYGINGAKIIAWRDLIKESKINPELLDSEIRKVANLAKLEEEAKSEIAQLETQQKALEETLKDLGEKKTQIELTIMTLRDNSLSQMEETRAKALSTISEMGKQATLSSENAKESLEATLMQVKSAASVFSSELTNSLKEVEPQLQNISQAIEAARQIGRYEAMLPLLKLTDSALADKVSETEALVSTWNVLNSFNAWLKRKYPDEEVEIADPLKVLIEALDGEIQSAGKKSG